MKRKYFLVQLISIALFILLSAQSCNENVNADSQKNFSAQSSLNKKNSEPFVLSDEFKNYWYAGKAEVSSYTLQQARYGEMHSGNAVTVFVTEDFSGSKQVKLDHPESAGNDKLPVFKLNLVKKFNTGIYPYSMMLSAYSPIDINNFPHAVKEDASVQEWCGMTYTQLNARNNKNDVVWHSYFEDEGDSNVSFNTCWLEDELWNLIRIAPDHLPTGNQTVLPGFLYTRMTHIPLKPQSAKLLLNEENGMMNYTIDVPSQQHTLVIHFEKNFPHKILGWEETFPGFDGKLLTTTAKLNKTIMTDYWVHHKDADRVMREELGLPKDTQ